MLDAEMPEPVLNVGALKVLNQYKGVRAAVSVLCTMRMEKEFGQDESTKNVQPWKEIVEVVSGESLLGTQPWPSAGVVGRLVPAPDEPTRLKTMHGECLGSPPDSG